MMGGPFPGGLPHRRLHVGVTNGVPQFTNSRRLDTLGTLPPTSHVPNTARTLSLLVLDDDADFRDSLIRLVEREGFSARGAGTIASARELMSKASFDAVLVDQELPDGQGIELLEPSTGSRPELIVITGHGNVSDAVGALKDGALDYLTKPLDPAKLRATLANLRRMRGLEKQVSVLRDELRQRGTFGSIIGRSPVMQAVFEMIEKVAPTEASVLIQGDSGTGKELVAQTIHTLSNRRDALLVPVNCGAIPETLIESELFGHERGSFTGADRERKGIFERADHGTLFLDEITEMPIQLQVRLLRVIETGQIQRVGSGSARPTDVRVLAATNRDPQEAIRQGRLREDLYFRLAVFPIRLPPLRERSGDIELLATHFLDRHNQAQRTDKRWSEGALEELASRDWPGNVRELKNAVQRAYILADDELRAADARVAPHRPTTAGEAHDAGALAVQVGSSIAEVERLLIQATLEHVDGNKAMAAKILGISLKTLYVRLNLYDAAPS
jgi:DNA-binding NtrC family response regulator